MNSIENLSSELTIILIAHRLSTVKIAIEFLNLMMENL